MAALVAALPESEGFVLAGGAAMAAHGLLNRTTRDLDYFGGPTDAPAVQRLADSFERAAAERGLQVERDRDGPAFVRFRVVDEHGECELDLGIDYRVLAPAETQYGPALDLRELGANKVLAIFDRSEPRDFIDLAELTKRWDLEDLIALAREKDPGLDLEVLEAFMARVRALPRADFEVDDPTYQELLAAVDDWRARVEHLHHEEPAKDRDVPSDGQDFGIDR
ncbi:MAG: nucleotidyl transferase AbiEii/AbiGii toxin family protein [Actinomycetota bacterium]|nr:nucleotidyl transferase AbiEii/AbiGii toxin family protein [Actinomycetota bacterium]